MLESGKALPSATRIGAAVESSPNQPGNKRCQRDTGIRLCDTMLRHRKRLYRRNAMQTTPSCRKPSHRFRCARWFAVAAGLVGLIASCSGQKSEQKNGDEGAAKSAAGPTTTLVLWEQDADIKDTFAAVIKTFETANPGIKIKSSNYANEDLRTQFQTAAIAGGGPDMVWGPTDIAGPFSIAGIIQPVGSWIKPGDFSALALQAVTDGSGVIWGVPVSTGNHLMLLSNKKLVAEPPKTLEALVAVAKSQSDPAANKYGFAYNLNEPFWFVTFLGGHGERVLSGTAPTLSTPAMSSALSLVKKLKFDDKIVPPDCDYDCADTLFKEGNVGMIINGDWSLPVYQKALGDDLVISPLPQIEATGKYMSPMVSGKCLFVNKKVKGARLDAVKKFVLHMVSTETQRQMVKRTKRLPSLKALQDSAVVNADPLLAASARALVHGQPMPMAVELRVVWDAIRPQLQEVMAGRADPGTVGAAMQKNAETKIKEMKQ